MTMPSTFGGGPTGVNSFQYDANFWVKIREMRQRLTAQGLSPEQVEAEVNRFLIANTVADQDRRTAWGQTTPGYVGPVGGPKPGMPTQPILPNTPYNPNVPENRTYNFMGKPYNYLGMQHLNMNPQYGYQEYADTIARQQPGGIDSPFGAFIRGQFEGEKNRYQVQSAQQLRSQEPLKWTDYLEKLGNDPLHRYRNLAPKVRGEQAVGRNTYGY